jgi:biopolymer transport protein ExbD
LGELVVLAVHLAATAVHVLLVALLVFMVVVVVAVPTLVFTLPQKAEMAVQAQSELSGPVTPVRSHQLAWGHHEFVH